MIGTQGLGGEVGGGLVGVPGLGVGGGGSVGGGVGVGGALGVGGGVGRGVGGGGVGGRVEGGVGGEEGPPQSRQNLMNVTAPLLFNMTLIDLTFAWLIAMV